VIAKPLGGRKAGAAWMARCPAREDREPSLSIKDADGGKVLVRCHVGCNQEQVIGAQGARQLARGRPPWHAHPLSTRTVMTKSTARAGVFRQKGRDYGCKSGQREVVEFLVIQFPVYLQACAPGSFCLDGGDTAFARPVESNGARMGSMSCW
jgi:hypothetical protein